MSTTDLPGVAKQAEAACEGIPGVTSFVCPHWCTDHQSVEGELGWHQSRTMQAGPLAVSFELDADMGAPLLVEIVNGSGGSGRHVVLPVGDVESLIRALLWALNEATGAEEVRLVKGAST